MSIASVQSFWPTPLRIRHSGAMRLAPMANSTSANNAAGVSRDAGAHGRSQSLPGTCSITGVDFSDHGPPRFYDTLRLELGGADDPNGPDSIHADPSAP